jgi:hypothetical protein
MFTRIKNWFIRNYQIIKFFLSSDYEPDYPWPEEDDHLDDSKKLV